MKEFKDKQDNYLKNLLSGIEGAGYCSVIEVGTKNK